MPFYVEDEADHFFHPIEHPTMKLLGSIIPLFAVATLAQKYTAGTNCHTNTECDANCLDGRWTIMQNDGDYSLVCDPSAENPTQYYAANCVLRSRPYQHEDTQQTKTCDAVGGTICNRACLFSGERSGEQELEKKYSDACLTDKRFKPIFYTYVTADAAKNAVGCTDSAVFADQ
jgi:hypothetical protein